ncbi:MAG: rRNA maturation RNase YbeY [Candidatus Jorgensenbacteria bacterium]
MIKVIVRSRYGRYEKLEKEVKKAARAALDFLGRDEVSVEINLVGDGEIRNLNRKFRGKNKVTNVLSFSEPKDFPHPESRLRFLGEVYLAPDYVRGKGEGLARLAVHGVLHLLGFSHSREGDRMKMEKLEEKING